MISMSNKKIVKRIVFITGTRADFGKIKSLIDIIDSTRNFEPIIFATGMHLMKGYGDTIVEIQSHNYKTIYPYVNQVNDIFPRMDITLAETIKGFSNYINYVKPDLIVVHGDRIESFAAAISGAFNNILVAHVEGGEISGTIDESIRHAISKLSHLHFVANEQAKKRLLQMGELANSIYVIGSPDIDILLSKDLPTLKEVRRRYNISFEKYSIFIYHPVTTDIQNLDQKTNNVIDALIESQNKYIVIHPNNDLGRDIIWNIIKDRLLDKSKFRVLPSMRFEHFLTLLKNSQFIIGNSSAGIREAPVYGIPCIDIGKRQYRRWNGKSIINVQEDKEVILNAISSIPRDLSSEFPFGEGESASKFLKCLLNENIWDMELQKYFNDILDT